MKNSPLYRTSVLITGLFAATCQPGCARSASRGGAGTSSQEGLSTAEQGECSTSCTLHDGDAQTDKGDAQTNEPTAPEGISFFERLRKEEWLALFYDSQGVYAIDGAGNINYIIPEPFDWITIDYGAGLLWLNRPWSKVADPGLFVVNLAAQEPALVKLTLLERGVEIQDSGGHILPMTEGDVPYRVLMNQSPISVVMSSTAMKGLVCGPECDLAEEAIALGQLAQTQYGVWTSPIPKMERLTYPEGEDIFVGTIRKLPLDQVDLELRAVALAGHPGTHVWQLYDVSAGEYISPEFGIRSKRKLEEGKHIDHLMICDGGRGIVVERGFFSPDLTRLDRRGNFGMGVCLTGGVLFEDRSGLRD